MQKIRLKPIGVMLIYLIVMITLTIGLIYFGSQIIKTENPINYITTSTITEEIKPVIKEEKTIIRPYEENNGVTILQNFYDYKSSKEKQEKSLIYYNNIYLQNSGVDYGKEESINVLSIYPGIVIDVKEDDVFGKTVVIEHSNNLIATYQCLKKVNVQKDDTVTIKEVIGTTGTCNISKNLGNHLHFEVSNNGEMIDPETIYGKAIDKIDVQ